MAKSKPALGRGLASLIPRPAALSSVDDGTGHDIVAHVDIARIQRNPYQPRADFNPETLEELTQSIREKGLVQPITVRRVEGGYQLISGERRVRAARAANLQQIPAYIIQVSSDEEMLELALIENLQREHLNLIEIAISYRRLIEECRQTQEVVAQRIGKDRSTVTNTLRLLKLPEVIQTAIRKGEVSGGHARALVAVENEKTQLLLFRRIIREGLSVRQIERLVKVKGKKSHRRASVSDIAEKSTLASIEERLRQLLGTKVQVRPLRHGKGDIQIEYYSADDLDRLVDIFEELQRRHR
ncbi:MAG: ParB/RepB/Spo0J family partition protein [Bacteroidetes bacterium]|nr:ParB/RepB/Spo0J family partition protein [Bacteroidota bacterium]